MYIHTCTCVYVCTQLPDSDTYNIASVVCFHDFLISESFMSSKQTSCNYTVNYCQDGMRVGIYELGKLVKNEEEFVPVLL